MERRQQRIVISNRALPWLLIAGALMALTLPWLVAVPARANVGYQLDATKPRIGIASDAPHGVAIDQQNQRIYVAVITPEFGSTETGWVEQLESNGTPSPNSPFTAGPNAFFSGVAVNPVTHGIYASRGFVETATTTLGEARMHQFSSTGAAGASFALTNATNAPQIAADSAGRVYYPNQATDSVEVFNSAGVLQSTITCSACPGGSFKWPASVALDSTGHVYVADMEGGFVAKMKPASESYGFDSLVQSNNYVVAVAVDPGTDDVFVGDLPEEHNYHIVAYDPSGVQYDDFGVGVISDPPHEGGIGTAAQIAVNGTTHKLYVSDNGGLWVFEKTTIPAPAVTTNPASPVGQITAGLNASVNTHGHAALECEFELVDGSKFAINGFTDAAVLPCPILPMGSNSTKVELEAAGLSPLTTYHYRLTVASNGGVTQSGEKIFTTLPLAAATVVTEGPAEVTETSALLRGKVNPHGGVVSSCRFQFGLSAAYESSLPCSSAPGVVATDVAEGRAVSGLLDDTAYHYRLVVTTNVGTVQGSDVEFRTSGSPLPPSSPAAQPAPIVPPLSPRPPSRPLHCKKGFQKKKVRGKLRCVKRKRHPASRRSHRSS